MNNKPVYEKVIENINQKGIKPIPKWLLTLKYSLLFFIIALFVLFSSIFFSIIFCVSTHADMAMYLRSGGPAGGFLAANLPLIWIILFILTIALITYFLKQTPKGYRFRLLWIILAMFIISIVIGRIMSVWQIGLRIEHYVQKKVPSYSQHFCHDRKFLWIDPANGRLAGKIITINQEIQEIEIEDFRGNKWSIKCSSGIKLDEYEVGFDIKIIGKQLNKENFQATEIKKWSFVPINN